MGTLVLWRPLTFWDEAQIEEIKKQELKFKINSDDKFKNLISEYREIENKINELEDERESKWAEMEILWKKYWINKNDLWKFT